MSRLDRHVAVVQGKLAVTRFLAAAGVAIMLFCAVVMVGVLVERLANVVVPHTAACVAVAGAVALLCAFGYAVARRPSAHQAAVAIDRQLGLDEKFATALFVRGSTNDPFALAAVRDAEQTADNVSLHRRFPVAFPRTGYGAMGAGIAVLLALWLLPQFDVLGREAQRKQAADAQAKRTTARQGAEHALATVASFPKAIQSLPQVELAKQDLQHRLDQTTGDVASLEQSASRAQAEAEAANKAEMKSSQQFAQAQTDQQMFKQLNPAADDHGPVAEASREITSGNFAKAIDTLATLPKQFDAMTPPEQKKAAQQMQQLAQQLQQMGQNPAALQNLQQQLQQMGANPQQAQQLAQAMQQAAQGNPQAQQQLQQMQQQMVKQMNNGQGPTPQQQQAIQQVAKQMQAAANSQATAQQMSAAAQQMAQAMGQAAQQQQAQAGRPGGQQASAQQQGRQGTQAAQQAAGAQPSAQATHPGGQQPGGQQANAQNPGGQQQPGGQQANGQQANAQKAGGQQPGGQQANGQKPGGQQAGGQQANGQQPGGQQPGGQQPGGQQPGGQQANGQQPGGQQPGGQQPGGQQAGGQQPGGQQPGAGDQPGMANAQQQMQQALGQMDAVQKDAEQMVAAQRAAEQPNEQGNNGNPGNGNKPGGPKPGQGQGQGPGGQPGGGPPPGVGGVGQKQAAQFTVKQQMDPSQHIDNGRMLAKTYVKAAPLVGQSTVQFTPAVAAAVKDSTDDVEEQSIPKDAQKVVKDYFNTMETAPAGK